MTPTESHYPKISTHRPHVPNSRVGWIQPITKERFRDFAKISSESFQETNLRGYVAQEVG